jgi:hypothetical protein
VEALLTATAEMPSPLIGLEENKITRKPLMKAVEVVSLSVSGLLRFFRANRLRDGPADPRGREGHQS